MKIPRNNICTASFKCWLFLFNTKVQASDKRLGVTGMLISFYRNCFIIIWFAANSRYFESNLWSLKAGILYLTVQVNTGPRFEVCQVGLGSVVPFLNGYYKGSESGCLPPQWIPGWRIRKANYLDTPIYSLCFIAHLLMDLRNDRGFATSGFISLITHVVLLKWVQQHFVNLYFNM